MACSCSRKKVTQEPPLARYSVTVSGSGGSVVSIGIKEECILEVNGVLQKVNAGDKVKTYDFCAEALLGIGAPVWIAA